VKLCLFLSFLLLTACSSTPTAKHTPVAKLATPDECDSVYARIVALKVIELEPEDTDRSNPLLRAQEYSAAVAINREYKANGMYDSFYTHCTLALTHEQVSCMLVANNIPSIQLCESFFDAKNQ
jgi:hypothetical protein